MFFRQLSEEEVKQFRQWARENWNPGDEIKMIWHPVVRDECYRIQKEVEGFPPHE